MTRVAIHYSDATAFGGCEIAMLRLARALPAPDWRSLVLHHHLPGAPLLDEAARFGVDTLYVPRIQKRTDVRGILRFASALRENHCAVFHAHQSWPLACKYGLITARLARIGAVVATSHLFYDISDFGYVLQQFQLMTGLVDRQIAVSAHVAKKLSQRFRVPLDAFHVIRNALDPGGGPPPVPARLVDELGAGTRPIILAAARLDEQKGLTYLIHAAESLPDALILLAGEGPLRAVLEAEVASRNVGNHVRFLGHRTDVQELMAASTVVVLPSLNEGLPLVVLEAMANGVPVVATAIGGTDEAVVDGETGLLVPPRDAHALAAALKRVISDPALAQRMGAAGRARLCEHFALEPMARATAALYDDVLHHRRTPALA